MIGYVIAESKWDADLLRRVLPLSLSGSLEFLDGGGPDGAKSMARSIVVSRRKPTAIVLNANTSDLPTIEAMRQSTKEFIKSVAMNVPIGIILAVPQLEYLFFEADGLLTRMFPHYGSTPFLSKFARSDARRALQELDRSSDFKALRSKLLDGILDDDLASLRRTKVIGELIEFLRGCQPRHVKIRLEIGPGIPSELQALKEPSGWKALIHAFSQVLTSDAWSGGAIASASSGGITVHVDPTKFDAHMEPPGSLPTTFVVELEGEARTEPGDTSGFVGAK